MEIIIIAAMTKSGVIGSGNKLPWNLPSEQRFFKHMTMGHAVIMGRKTFESIGHPLPGRRNYVLTSSPLPLHADVRQATKLPAALNSCSQESKVFIIGGFKVYREALKYADTMLLTIIDHPFSGDTYFPPWPQDSFALDGRVTVIGPTSYTISMFRRKKCLQQVS